MRHLIRMILFFFFILSSRPWERTFARQEAQNGGNLDFLKKFDGKYPHEIQFFKNPALRTRLQKLMGKQYTFLVKEIFQVETPIRVEGNFFYVWGMQTHSGGNPSAKIIADIAKNKLYVEILKNEQTQIFAEDGSKAIPKDLESWVKKQS
jgi:hypothetical protein